MNETLMDSLLHIAQLIHEMVAKQPMLFSFTTDEYAVALRAVRALSMRAGLG